MSKILLLFLALVVGIMAASFYVLGLLRRFFGISASPRKNPFSPFSQSSSNRDGAQKILYQKQNTTVLNGEHVEKQSPKEHHIQDASYSERPSDKAS